MLDVASLSEKENLQIHTIFEGRLFPIRDTPKVYGATDFDWIYHTNMNYSELQGGPYEVYLCPGSDPVCEKAWPFLNKIIAKAVGAITPLLDLAGVDDTHKPLFWSKFSYCKEPLIVYVA